MYRFIVVLIFLTFLYCATGFKMVPAPEAEKTGALEGAAHVELAGVEILVETEAWYGRPEILDKITPLRLTIQNNSGKLLLIRYSEFKISGVNSGKIYAALPPYEIRGTIEEPWLVLPYPFPVDPSIDCDKFSVAPYCSRMYPAFPAYRDTFPIDSLYYSHYYTVYSKIALPTVDMIKRVLPDGVIENDGHVSGFLYFEKVNRDEEQLEFTADLIDAVRGELLGTVKIPFLMVKKKRAGSRDRLY